MLNCFPAACLWRRIWHVSRDGHGFIPRAIKKGAAAIIGERARAELPVFDAPYVQVEDTQRANSYLAAAYRHHPSRKLTCDRCDGDGT